MEAREAGPPEKAAFLEFRLLVEREEVGEPPYRPPLPDRSTSRGRQELLLFAVPCGRQPPGLCDPSPLPRALIAAPSSPQPLTGASNDVGSRPSTASEGHANGSKCSHSPGTERPACRAASSTIRPELGGGSDSQTVPSSTAPSSRDRRSASKRARSDRVADRSRVPSCGAHVGAAG